MGFLFILWGYRGEGGEWTVNTLILILKCKWKIGQKTILSFISYCIVSISFCIKCRFWMGGNRVVIVSVRIYTVLDQTVSDLHFKNSTHCLKCSCNCIYYIEISKFCISVKYCFHNTIVLS